MRDTLALLRQRNVPIRFVSSNPTEDPDQYIQKLSRLSLHVVREEVVSTIATTVGWLTEHHPEAVLFPITEQPLTDALRAAGFRLCEDAGDIDVVVASHDRTFEYRKLQIAFDALRSDRGVTLIQTSPDKFCPFPGGRGEPDCAAVVAAIQACTGAPVTANLGKPDPLMAAHAMRTLGVEANDVAIVGDRLSTDVAMGAAAGMASFLVLTGDSTHSDAQAAGPAERPTFVIDSLDKLTPQPTGASPRG